MSQQGPSIAFFDLDRTLISINSASKWIRREVRLGHLSRWQASRAGVSILMYHAGFSRIENTLRGAVLLLKGESQANVLQRTEDFWLDDVIHTIRPGARKAIETHRAKGDRIALLTSSTFMLCQHVAQELPVDDILCNRLIVENGLFTGFAEEPICFGRGKVHYAQQLAKQQNVALNQCFFYTDSFSDLPVMNVVGHPIAVHPDPRLTRHAKRENWPILDWD